MIEFVTNLMISLFIGFLCILELVYVFHVCMIKHTWKLAYPKKEFIKDLLIPFRKWYLKIKSWKYY